MVRAIDAPLDLSLTATCNPMISRVCILCLLDLLRLYKATRRSERNVVCRSKSRRPGHFANKKESFSALGGVWAAQRPSIVENMDSSHSWETKNKYMEGTQPSCRNVRHPRKRYLRTPPSIMVVVLGGWPPNFSSFS